MMLDKWTPYTTSRWVFTVLLVLAFTARILIAQVDLVLVVVLAINRFYISGLVHSNLCLGNLPFKSIAGISDSQD